MKKAGASHGAGLPRARPADPPAGLAHPYQRRQVVSEKPFRLVVVHLTVELDG